jgi:hypothetical protein
MKQIKALITILAFALISACAQIGFVTPQTTSQRIAVAQASVTEVRRQTTVLLNAKAIKADDAENIQNLANNARTAIDISRAVLLADPTATAAADAKLAVATTLLTSLQQYLITKQGAAQ